MRVIVDSCVWAQFLRRARLPVDRVAQEVARLARADALQMLGPIRLKIFTTDSDFAAYAKHIPITLHRERAIR